MTLAPPGADKTSSGGVVSSAPFAFVTTAPGKLLITAAGPVTAAPSFGGTMLSAAPGTLVITAPGRFSTGTVALAPPGSDTTKSGGFV